VLGLIAQRVECLGDTGQRGRAERGQTGGGEIGAQISQQQANGAEDAGRAGNQDTADLQLVREPR
jgi:hypothetical protein